MTVWTNASLRTLENDSIRGFVELQAPLLTGRVLDFGAGRSPYSYVVDQAGGVYIPYDRADFPANVSGADIGPDETEWSDFDAILCLQVIQYIRDVADLLGGFCDLLRGGDPGVLIMTGGVNWPEIETTERARYTQAGIEAVLAEVGFRDVTVNGRAGLGFSDFMLSLGWGAVAYA